MEVKMVNDPFLLMYDLYFDDVYRYVLFKVGDKWDTDDIVSDVFRKAFEKSKSVREANVKPWLMTIARNTVIDHYRKKRDITIGDDIEKLTYPVWFEDTLEKKDDLDCLKKGLHHLEKEELEIINMHYFSDMKFRDIGEVLGKSESSVKVKSFRLLKKIGAFVKQCMEGTPWMKNS